MTPLIAKSRKPRNPFVAAARFRQAGRHAPQTGAGRQAGRRALREELSRLEPSRDPRRGSPGD